MTAHTLTRIRPARRALHIVVATSLMLLGAMALSTPADAVDQLPSAIQGQVCIPSGCGGATAPGHTGRFGAQIPHGVGGGGGEVPGALIEICHVGGECESRTTDAQGMYAATGLAVGEYSVRMMPPPGNLSLTQTTSVQTSAGVTSVVNFNLKYASTLPNGTTINETGPGQGGPPVLYWNNNVLLTTTACPGGIAGYTVTLESGELAQGGGMTESPAGSGHYTVTGPPLYPYHGNATVHITVTCPDPDPPVNIDFNVYIDPSGVVQDTEGNPLPGATVTLSRSDFAVGPFSVVPDGDAIMSPTNRTNPDVTDAVGHFGWDVIAGYYVVEATAPGCHKPGEEGEEEVDTGVLTIPPPVTDLVLVFECPEVHLTGVDVKPAQGSTINLAPEQFRQLTVNATYSDGSTADVTGDASFELFPSGTTLANVSGLGVLAAENSIREATVSLLVTYQDIVVAKSVAISPVSSILVRPNPVYLHSASHPTQQLIAVAILDNGAPTGITTIAGWTSSNAYRVKVTQKGYLKQNHPQVGDVTITAAYDGKSGTTLVHNQSTPPG